VGPVRAFGWIESLKSLDFQILLQRPAVLISRGDGRGGKTEIVREELKLPLLLLIIEAHQLKLTGALLTTAAPARSPAICARAPIGRTESRRAVASSSRPAHAPSTEPAHLALEVRARNKLEYLTEQAT